MNSEPMPLRPQSRNVVRVDPATMHNALRKAGATTSSRGADGHWPPPRRGEYPIVFEGAMKPTHRVPAKPGAGPPRIPTRSRRSPSWITWACAAVSIGAVVAIVFGGR